MSVFWDLERLSYFTFYACFGKCNTGLVSFVASFTYLQDDELDATLSLVWKILSRVYGWCVSNNNTAALHADHVQQLAAGCHNNGLLCYQRNSQPPNYMFRHWLITPRFSLLTVTDNVYWSLGLWLFIYLHSTQLPLCMWYPNKTLIRFHVKY